MKSPTCLLILAVAVAAQAQSFVPIYKQPRPNPGSAEGRIVGGKEAKPHSLPFMAALYIFNPVGVFFCTGSLINNNMVLTAAHCCAGAVNIIVVLGAHNISAVEDTQQIILASKITPHPNYDPATITNDICTVNLETPPTLNKYVQPIKLPCECKDHNKPKRVKSATVAGWGKTSDNSSSISDVLKLRHVNLEPIRLCREAGFPVNKTTEFCVSKGVCNGDSGGPMFVKSKCKGYKFTDIIIGLTSYGSAAGCQAGYPTVFTNVNYFNEFIEDSGASCKK